MEVWEQLVETWSGDVDIAGFSRLSHIAETVLKEDLADFEIEWISSSLLHSPVHLLKLVRSHSGDSSWTKPVTDAFKLISTFVKRYPECSDQYRDEIVKVCQSPLDGRSRGAALHCLSTVAGRSLQGLRPATYLAELETATTCKAPLATLIGTICEYHPEAVADDINRVWRAYLNLLECNKNTDAVRTAALRGAGRVLTCFGEDLPMAEVALLYPHLTSNVGDVSLQLLEKHAPLFREQLGSDAGLRRRLWAAAAEPGALLAARVARVVTEAACASDPALAQVIVQREMVPLTSSPVPRVRYTAARVCACARDVTNMAAAPPLEFQLRTDIDDVPDSVAEAVCWCVEARVPHYKVLLQTAILYHERLKPTRLNDIVVQGLRNEVKQTNFNFNESALQFLVTESCRPGGIERYRVLWAALCESSEGNSVVEKLASHVANLLRGHSAWNEELPSHLESLLRVCVCAFSSYKGETALRWITPPLCAVRCDPLPAPVLTLMTMLPDGCDVTPLYQRVDILRAKDEESICASALALLHAPLDVANTENLLTAIQLILSRKDAEPATLSRALRLLSRLLDAGQTRHEEKISQILRLVIRLREHFFGSAKDARVLRRDLDLFLGKHGCGDSCYISELDHLVAQLGDKLTLTLPGDSGEDCQINLRQVLKLALEQEDQDSLDILIAVICDHAEMRSSNPPEAMLSLVSRALEVRAKRTARGETITPSTPDIPALATHLLQRICACMGVGTRHVLCQMLRPLLRDVTLRRLTGDVLNTLASQQLLSRLGALDATVPVVSALREDSVLASEWLLRFPPLLVESNEASSIQALKLTVDACLDLRHVFSASALNIMTENLLKALLKAPTTSYTQTITYKILIQISVDFLKKIVEDSARVTEIVFRMCKRDGNSMQCLYLIAVLKKELGFDSKVVLEQEEWMVKTLEGKGGNDFDTEAVLVFVAEFADALLEVYYEGTISVLCDIVSRLSPGSVQVLQQPLRLSALAVGAPPPTLARALEAWSDTLPFDEIAEYLQSYNFLPSHVEAVSAMRAVLEAWRVPHATHLFTRVRSAAVVWPRHILRLYAQTPTVMQEHKSYLLDLLWLGIRLGSSDDLSQLLVDDLTITSLSFSREFMPAMYTFFLCKPLVLCKPELSSCCVLLTDIANYCDQNHADQLLALADELWDLYTSKSDATSCAALLTTLVRMGARETNRCVSETARRVSETELSLQDLAVLLPALPPCDVVSAAHVSSVRRLPLRLAECCGEFAVALRSVLDACASGPHAALLRWLATLAAGEDIVGWWDAAMESCMASLAVSATSETLRNLHALALLNPLSTGAVDRLLVPLIRFSAATVSEQFYSTLLPSTLVRMRSAPAVADSVAYRRVVVADTNHVTLLALLVEKVPRGSLESPSSVLHSNASDTGNAVRPWHYVREACRLIVTLQGKIVAPSQASDELCFVVRRFQQRAYNALCALVCVWRADERLYTRVTDAAFHTLVETDTYQLPLRALPSHRTLIAAGGEKPNEVGVAGGTRTLGTTTQRVFLRTLTENPYCFDLHEDNEETERIEMIVSDSALNRHPCAGAITALLKHLAGPGGPKLKNPVTTGQIQGHKSTQVTIVGKGPARSTTELGGPSTEAPVTPEWLKAFCKALCNTNQNVRWLLSQCIVNARTELRELASSLSPGLLAVVRDTGGNALNSLHIDILDTVAWWYTTNSATPPCSYQATPPLDLLSACAHVLMRTCVDVHERKGVHYALLGTISSFLKEFPSVQVEWDVFRRYLDGNVSGCVSACVRVLTRACRAGLYTPELARALLHVMDRNQTHIPLTDLAKLFSLVIPTIPSASEKARVCEQYSNIAMRVRRDNITNYINMLHYGQCTALEHFKHVADTAAKVRPVRAKCVSVLAASLRANMCANMLGERARSLRDQLPADLRADVMRDCADVAFDELFPPSSSSPVAKRARTEQTRSVLLATRASEKPLAHTLHTLTHTQRREKLDEKMAEDLATRLVECFYVCVYLPCKYPPSSSPLVPTSEGERLCSLLTLLLLRLRSQPRHMRATLPRPTVARHASVINAACGTRAGTLRTHTLPALTRHTHTRGHILPVAVVKEDSPEDAPTPLDKALETFLKFGESCWEASCSILSSLCRASMRGEQANVLANMLADTLTTAPGPSLLRLAIELMPLLADISPFEATVGKLSQQWARTEAASELRILQDEFRLRTPPHPALKLLGTSISDADDVMSPHLKDEDFSIEALVKSFGRMSEWSHKTIRERRRIETDLPELWTTAGRFLVLLQSYKSEGGDWFAQCVRIRRGCNDVTRTLRSAVRWPRDHFHVSAVAETIELLKRNDVTSVPETNDDSCLVEWAARLQLRASGTEDDDRASSRSHALAWSKVALERRLPKLALQCIRIHIDDGDVLESEVLSWINLRARALLTLGRGGGVGGMDQHNLRKALKTAESGLQFVEVSSANDVLELCLLLVQLHMDLETLTDNIVEEALSIARTASERDSNVCDKDDTRTKEGDSIRELSETAILHYDDTWDTRDPDASLTLICDVLKRCASEIGVAVVLNRLAKEEVEQNIGEKASDLLLDTLLPVIPSLQDHFATRLVLCLPTLPATSLDKHKDVIDKLTDRSLDKWRRCLQLLCGAEQTLLAHCEALQKALQAADADQWRRAFARMRTEVFENELAGADYRALHTHKHTLYDIEHTGEEMSPTNISKCETTLVSVMSALSRLTRTRRSVAALCPALAASDSSVTDALADILHLGRGQLLGLEDEMYVFTDSVCSPGILCVRLADSRRRYLVKRERVALSSCFAASAAALATSVTPQLPPQVIVLSEDCGLVEFLEGHERVRDLIQEEVNLSGIPIKRQAQRNEELMLAPEHLALKSFEDIVQHVPPMAFRRAYFHRCADIRHFLSSQRIYTSSLASMTVLTWLLGLGDRHLNNVLTSPTAGTVCAVDTGALFHRELVPARLTAQFTSILTEGVLEARLQQAIQVLRDKRRRVMPLLTLAVLDSLPEHAHQVEVIEQLISGKLSPHEATVLAAGEQASHAARLLRDLFPATPGNVYHATVQQQVSSVLLQSTSPRVLSVIRSEWEPWL